MTDVAPLPSIFIDQPDIDEDDSLPVEEHPVDDPALPSYQCEEYREVLPDLLMMRELWYGQSSWMAGGKVTQKAIAKKYLPQEQVEDDNQYDGRLIRSPFENFIEPAITGYAGLMSDIKLGEEVDSSIVEHQTNVDMQGNNLATFWSECDSLALRDGSVAVVTEYPEQVLDEDGNSAIKDYESQLKVVRRPYFCLVERIDIPNWDVSFENGKLSIEQVTIRETHKVKLDRFGSKTVTRYRVMTPGYYEVWEIVKNFEGKPVGRIVDEGKLLARNKSIQPPLVVYSPGSLNPFVAGIPMLNLARLNVRHFQSSSDYYEVERKCNLPVPVRKGLIVEGQVDFKNLPPVTIGANSVIDLPSSGSFGFAEPSGSAIGASRTTILDIESSILRKTLSALGDGGGNKTATESTLRATQSQSLVMNLATHKESAMEQAFDLWAQYEGRDKGGRPEVRKDVLISIMESQMVATLSGLEEKGQLTLRTFLQLLVNGKVLPRDTDIDAEIAAVQAAKVANIQMATQAMIDQSKGMAEAQAGLTEEDPPEQGQEKTAPGGAVEGEG